MVNLNYELTGEDGAPLVIDNVVFTSRKAITRALWSAGFGKDDDMGEEAVDIFMKVKNCHEDNIDFTTEEAAITIKCAKKMYVAGIVAQLEWLFAGKL